MRNWSAILVDAGIRNLTVSQLAREQDTDAHQVSKAARRYGIALVHARPHAPKRRGEIEWRALFRESPHGETITQFCIRAQCSMGTATYWAKHLKHEFAPTVGGRRPWVGKSQSQGRSA